MSEPTFTKEYIQELLHDTNLKDLYITFTKTDGTERNMRCTLLTNKIPTDKTPKGTGSTSSETAQRVFDLDKQEWRSFKWDAVKSIQFEV